MNFQNTLFAVLFVMVLFGFIVMGIFFTTNNTCIKYETGIKAQFEQNKNNYDNYWKKLVEMAQIPEMFRDDLKDVYDGAMRGRYGADGSKAVLQMITEQNPNLDASLYKQIQQNIEAGRNVFESEQKSLISRKQEYEMYLGSMPNGLVAKFFGFPKIDLEKFKIVTSEKTKKDFETGESDPFKLRQKAEKN